MTDIIGNAPYLEKILPKVAVLSSWETPEAFTKHVASLDKKKAWSKSGWDKGKEFHGTETMEETLDLATNGWREGRDKVIALRDSIASSRPMLPKPLKFGIAGTVPDVPRAIAGNPMNMRLPDLAKSKRRPVMTLVYNMCSSWTTDESAISNAAAAVASLIDQIETNGYSCEVISAALTQDYGDKDNKVLTCVITKNAGTHVDIERLAFFMGHSSMFRRMIFADWGSNPAAKFIGGSLGCVSAFKPTEEDKAKNVFFIPSIQKVTKLFKDEQTTMKEGLDFFIQELAKQGCPAFSHIEVKKIEDKEEDDD